MAVVSDAPRARVITNARRERGGAPHTSTLGGMTSDPIISWGLLGLFVLAGVGVLVARVDEQQVQKLEALNRFFPGARMAQFRVFRYGAAIAFFVMASVVYIEALS